jgi:hypothetical protein
MFENLTVEERVKYLVAKLRVNKTNLSATVRKKTCASDERFESKVIGYIAAASIFLLPGACVIIDIMNLYKHLTTIKQVSPNVTASKMTLESAV